MDLTIFDKNAMSKIIGKKKSCKVFFSPATQGIKEYFMQRFKMASHIDRETGRECMIIGGQK